jgi:hypothetical protein
MTKICTCCKQEKPLTEFTRRRFVYKGVERWGHKSHCKPCHTMKTRIARGVDLEKARAREKELRERRLGLETPEQKEARRLKALEWQRAWNAANRDKVKASKLRRRDKELAYKRKRYQEKIDELRAKCREYYTTHKEEIRERNKRNNQQPEVQARRKAYHQARRPQDRVRMREKIRNLDDNYIKTVIRRNVGLPAHMQSKQLIEAQKLILKIKRELRS